MYDLHDPIRSVELFVELPKPFADLWSRSKMIPLPKAEIREAPDLLLTDVIMPGMAGTELARRLRQEQHFIMGDETDEQNFGFNTRTIIFDVADLLDPQLNGEYFHSTVTPDHNIYTLGDYIYQANYSGGLRVLEATDVASRDVRVRVDRQRRFGFGRDPGDAANRRSTRPRRAAPGPDDLTWQAPLDLGGVSVVYDTLRSVDPADFNAATCIESDDTDLTATDGTTPISLFAYLVRAENTCGGQMGADSSGTPRSGAACP